jgi:hypothetical protein
MEPELWAQISPSGGYRGILCPWCASKRLVALGLHTRVEVNLLLPGFDGSNPRTMVMLTEIDRAHGAERNA